MSVSYGDGVEVKDQFYLFREILTGQEGSSVVWLQWRWSHDATRVGLSQGLSGGSVLG